MLCKLDSNEYTRSFEQNPKLTLRWGWIFSERTRILNEIQFTTHFIDYFVVETKRFVSSKHDLDAANLRPVLKQGCGR